MTDLLTPEALEAFLFFVVPGFVAMKSHDLLVPSETRSWGDSLLEAVSYSMLNLALLFWLVAILQKEGFQDRYPLAYMLGIFVTVFIAPVGWAVMVRYIRTSRRLRQIVLHPSPTAWDYFFDLRRPFWVIVHLKSGDMFGGFYGEKSFASSFVRGQDLYLEEVWRLDDEGRFIERIEQTAGALVRRDDCTHIEVFEGSTT
jgi:hypothetical protein